MEQATFNPPIKAFSRESYRPIYMHAVDGDRALVAESRYENDTYHLRWHHTSGIEMKPPAEPSQDFGAWLMALHELIKEADSFAPYPVQVQVHAEPLGDRVLMADLGNKAFEEKYPPLTLEERAEGKKRIPQEALPQVRELAKEALTIDGSHHKQWYLEAIAKLCGIDQEWLDANSAEDAIAP